MDGLPGRGEPQMSSVVQRIAEIKQPRGGYLPPQLFARSDIDFSFGCRLLMPYGMENVHPSLVGLAVDYLSRYYAGAGFDEAFAISIAGAAMADRLGQSGCVDFVRQVKGYFLATDSRKIQAMLSVFMVQFDIYARACHGPKHGPGEPNEAVIANIISMTDRTLEFLSQAGPDIISPLRFDGGYTEVITAGDGDFMTADTLWDMKVSVHGPKPAHTLQLLLYWMLGMNSIYPYYRNVSHLGLFNPRLGAAYRYDLRRLDDDMVAEVGRIAAGMNDTQIENVLNALAELRRT